MTKKTYNVYYDGDYQFEAKVDAHEEAEMDAAGYTLIEVDENGKEIREEW